MCLPDMLLNWDCLCHAHVGMSSQQDEKRVPAHLLQHFSGRAVASSIGQDRYCKFAKVQDCTFDGPLS